MHRTLSHCMMDIYADWVAVTDKIMTEFDVCHMGMFVSLLV